MKKLKDLTIVDKFNVSELMTLKGGVIPSVFKGCDTQGCVQHVCSSSSICASFGCNYQACMTHLD